MKRIMVDSACWSNARGYGRHARALMTALIQNDKEDEFTFILDKFDESAIFPEGVQVQWVETDTPATMAASASGNRSLPDMWKISRALSSPGYDLLLFPSLYTYVPVFSRARKIVIIHDAIPEIFPKLTLPSIRARTFWRLKSYLSRMQANAIVTVSEYSRVQLIEQFKLDPDKIFVVGEASDPIFKVLEDAPMPDEILAAGVPSTSRLIVYVGGFGPHKNLKRLLESFGDLAQLPEYSDVYLILVGEQHKEVFFSESGELQTIIRQSGMAERIVFTGFLQDEKLVWLLNLSTVLVLPSLMEGFGLPALEAAACGCPVIATRESPLPQLLGDASIYFDPLRVDELTYAMKEVLDSTTVRHQMRQKGLLAAGRLTWDDAARQLLNVFDQVSNG